MGKIMAQLERMGSSDYWNDTPSTVTEKDMPEEVEQSDFGDMFSETTSEPYLMSDKEMYGEDGITTDVGEQHNISISGGKQAGWKDDRDRIEKELAKGGSGKGPVPVKPISGRPPPMPGIPEGSSSYSPTQSPYGIPSVLSSQAAINNNVIQTISQSLEHTMVDRPFLKFTGLV
jgi:hypothetical protein